MRIVDDQGSRSIKYLENYVIFSNKNFFKKTKKEVIPIKTDEILEHMLTVDDHGSRSFAYL